MTVRPLSQTNVPIAERLAARPGAARPHRRRQARAAAARARVPAGARPPADRRHPRRGQVDARAGARHDARPQVRPRPVHERPPAGRRARRVDLRHERRAFRFHPGPIFNSVVLADEINRAPPKTQSALLEAMEERQVSQDGQTRKLPDPFFVIATQNPVEQIGAYPLPESQLDRFLMAIELGYPDPAAERELLIERRPARADRRRSRPLADPPTLLEWQTRSRRRSTSSPALLDYVQALLAATRGNVGGGARRRRTARAVAARGTDAARGRARVGADVRPPDGAARGRAGGVPVGRRTSARRRRARGRLAGAGAVAHRRAAVGRMNAPRCAFAPPRSEARATGKAVPTRRAPMSTPSFARLARAAAPAPDRGAPAICSGSSAMRPPTTIRSSCAIRASTSCRRGAAGRCSPRSG